MREVPPGKTRLTINVLIDEDLRIKMIELGISPSDVAKRALMSAVSKHYQRARRQNKDSMLQAVRGFDPRIKADQLTTSTRAKRLRRLAAVMDQSVDSDTL